MLILAKKIIIMFAKLVAIGCLCLLGGGFLIVGPFV